MQQSAVPELAHTHTRPIHWLATATAVAGVVALSSVLQPNSATAAQTTGPDAKHAPAALAPPDPARADFPLECGPVKAIVVKKATGDLDGDASPETVVVVHCDAPMGTPPDGIYVLTHSAGTTTPRVAATLVDPKDSTTVSDITVRDGAVIADLLGYSSDDVPRCCPDVKSSAKWQWKNGAFIRSTPSGAHSV
ncbi:hypothetical protein ACM01_30065 [Streptomyces viridochromogenes]|uniref:Secreted protein n=1 Tax=Streptomyces viridochromogenes TaxID=1938 RepID=A0A0J7Z6F1_STRVR|nr:hypothetical protein [Streptomyces viridochromogenes]KMS70778.1 hypothetical protein ACM01_30065 [Streptomyces viridochromogenes]KOG23773.1 hypothetical protein ADK36_09055 [Streptomyces viridochromogenes]KOG24761.1 hypothetical protein ADK35_10140 [Streptomyces viridochromogenes]